MEEQEPDILDKAVALWLGHLTQDELVELSERLDGDRFDTLQEKLDEHLMVVRPDLFVDPSYGVGKKPKVQS